MATTIAINVGTTAVPPGSVGQGNVVVTEGDVAAVRVKSVRVFLTTKAGQVTPLAVHMPSPRSGALEGGGTCGDGFALAQNTSVSLGFSFPSVAGTLKAEAVVDDGSEPTATQAVTVA